MAKPKQFDWRASDFGGFCAEMPASVTLVASPDRTAGFGLAAGSRHRFGALKRANGTNPRAP